MTVSAATLVALVVAVVGPLVAYITASRKLSGRIGTSEAGQLWAESKEIRDDYRDRLTATDIRQASLEARVSLLEGLNNELSRENIRLSTQASTYEVTIADLRKRLEALERENAHLRDQIAELERKAE